MTNTISKTVSKNESATSFWQSVKRKLQSRKVWAAILSFLTAMGSAFALDQALWGQVILIVSGIGAMCVYILSESRVDAERMRLEEFDLFADGVIDKGEWDTVENQ